MNKMIKKYYISLEIRHKNGNIDIVEKSIMAHNQKQALIKLKRSLTGKYKNKEVRYNFY